MQRKYTVSSVSFVIPMTVGFSSNETEENYSIQVHVDMMNGEVYFLDDKIDGIDYEDLKEEIFLKVRPRLIQQPTIPEGIEDRVKKISSSKKPL